MVPLPLFKFASLFVRHISKYGANWIKDQAHDHPKFRVIAARYGQHLHQLSMRLQVTLLRDRAAERRAKIKAETPTVKTEAETKSEEATKKKREWDSKGANTQEVSVWRRKFRPLHEEKAVDLFADVIGDSFILGVAIALILYEYLKAAGKPDSNAEKIAELRAKLEDLTLREQELREAETAQKTRFETLEQAIEEMKRATAEAKGKKRILSVS